MAQFPNHLVPEETKKLDIGTDRRRWRKIWADTLDLVTATIGTLTVSGATTIDGTLTVNDAATFEGNNVSGGSFDFEMATTFYATVNGDGVVMGGFRRPVTRGTAASYSPATTDSGRVYIATRTSSTQTYTLPAATTNGLVFSFICGHADGEILITPQTGETISIFTFSAIGADADTATVAPAAGTGIKNTAATNVIGDSVTLVSDGSAGWFSLGPTTGIWASQ